MKKKILLGLGAFMVIGSIGMYMNGEDLAIVAGGLGLAALAFIIALKKPSEKIEFTELSESQKLADAKMAKNVNPEIEILYKSPAAVVPLNSSIVPPPGFKNKTFFESFGDKSVFMHSGNVSLTPMQGIVVDDANKEFYVVEHHALHRYEYSKLLGYEYSEDDMVVSAGKGVATAAGGLTFGVVGAMVGASGSRKQIKNVTNAKLNLTINSLHTNLISLPIIIYKTPTSSPAYKNAKSKADEMLALLTYIKNN